jgi:hypothetical protein
MCIQLRFLKIPLYSPQFRKYFSKDTIFDGKPKKSGEFDGILCGEFREIFSKVTWFRSRRIIFFKFP